MFEDYSRNRRFIGWLETVATDTRSSYPDPETFAEDTRAFLAKFDRIRSDQRQLDKCYRELLSSVGELAEVKPQTQPTQVMEALKAKFAAVEETGSSRNAELESELDAMRENLEATRAELETAQARLAETQSELQREKRKLDPVLRYAYNLRRLVQKIYAKGEVTPSIRRYIEELLAAGGASVDVGTQPAGSARSPNNATSTIT